jgi:hypothetical protein
MSKKVESTPLSPLWFYPYVRKSVEVRYSLGDVSAATASRPGGGGRVTAAKKARPPAKPTKTAKGRG